MGSSDIFLTEPALLKSFTINQIPVAIKILDYLLFKLDYSKEVTSADLKRYFKGIVTPSQIDETLSVMETSGILSRDEYEVLVASEVCLERIADLYSKTKDPRGGKREKKKPELVPNPVQEEPKDKMDDVLAKYGLTK